MSMKVKKLGAGAGSVTVATAGTRVQITTNDAIFCNSFTVLNSGPGKIFVGNELVDNTWPSIESGEQVSFSSVGYLYRLSDYYIDSDTNNTSVVVVYEQDRS